MYARIVVPLDGSEVAERALPQAEELARRLSVPLHLVRVVDLTRLARYGPYALAVPAAAFDQVFEEERAAAQEYLDLTARRLEAEGLPLTTELRHGSVGRELVDLPADDDLVVMASHGRGGLRRWFLGSVAEEVVRRSRVPVLLVRVDPQGSGSGTILRDDPQ
jgi:nucleotide-binding universal stress UspA family protein